MLIRTRKRLVPPLSLALLIAAAVFGQASGTAQETAADDATTSAVRSDSEQPDGNTGVGATSTEPIYEAFLTAGVDPQLAYAAAERVESVAGDNVTTAISAQISNLEARLDARFSNLESKLDARFSSLEAKVDSQQSELATVRWAVMIQTAILVLLLTLGFSLQHRVGKFEGRIGILEERVGNLEGQVEDLRRSVEDLNARVTALEQYVREIYAVVTKGSATAGTPASPTKAESADVGAAGATSSESS